MIYIGILLVVIGTGVGVFLSGAAEADVISCSAGVGGMTIYAGARGGFQSQAKSLFDCLVRLSRKRIIHFRANPPSCLQQTVLIRFVRKADLGWFLD